AASVIQTMTDQMTNTFGNASSTHAFGRAAREVLDDSRHVIAQSINAADDDIIFTSGGTESDNTAVGVSFDEFILEAGKQSAAMLLALFAAQN
ncbi:hypothetical protein WP50_37945, partial [Lactiplantibacillus plantarum]